MTIKYRFIGAYDPQNWSALPKKFKVGDIVEKYNKYDYGCSADDFRYMSVSTISCTVDQKTFFTVPVYMIREIEE